MKPLSPIPVLHRASMMQWLRVLSNRWRLLGRLNDSAMRVRGVPSPEVDVSTSGYTTTVSMPSMPSMDEADTTHEHSVLSAREPPLPRGILVASTTSTFTDTLQLELAQAGFCVMIAHTGEEAFAIVQEHHPQLLVLDRQLPLMSGLELCRIIRKDSHMPIIIVAEHAPTDEQIEALNLGVDAYVTQPFSQRELSARIRAVLRRTSS